jgi:anti-sigma regulatory factor (Ser/Thr protein kinase)
MPTFEQADSLPLTPFPSVVGSVAGARRLLADFVTGKVTPAVVEDALLLSSELTTNAVIHAHTEFSLAAVLTTDVLHISVTDGQRSPPILTHPVRGAVGGWGMHLVDAVAARWGVEQLDTGKRVWFELDTNDAPGP